MRSPLLAACAGSLVLGGCQLVLPIHEVSDAGDSSPPSDGAGADTASASETGSGDATMTCDKVFTGRKACDACVNQMCCSEIIQCFDVDSECAALEKCIENCGLGDFGCPSQCGSTYPSGENDYGSLVECTQGCDGACGDAG
jgi:hypothetical protein